MKSKIQNTKVAIPTKGDKLGLPFGYCKYYTIYTVNEEDKIENSELLTSPKGFGCTSTIVPVLAEKGVSVMLTGNMGTSAIEILNSGNIKVITGYSGMVSEVIHQYLRGETINDEKRNTDHKHQHQNFHSEHFLKIYTKN